MATPDAPALTSDRIAQLAEALREWAGRHPEPDAPVLEFAGATPLSPRQIANAVAQMSEDGCNFVRMVEFGQQPNLFEQDVEKAARGLVLSGKTVGNTVIWMAAHINWRGLVVRGNGSATV